MNGDTLRLITQIDIPTSTSVSDWISTAFKYDANSERLIFGTLTSGDSIELQIAASAGTPSIIRTSKVYTSVSFDDVIYGPVPRIRFRKVGTNGPATIILVK